MRFRPAWAYIDGIREFGRFFCQATFGTQELADRACVAIQGTLENAVKYSTDSGDSELELSIESDGSNIEFSVSSLPEARHETVAIQLTEPNQVKLSGTITQKAPSNYLAGFFKALHAAAVADKLTEVRADVSGLTFVNSSAIRLFVDWATWVKSELSRRYTLRFVTNRNVTWQKTSFTALLSLMKEVLAVEQVT